MRVDWINSWLVSMTRRICATCSYESPVLTDVQTLFLTVDSEKILSLQCSTGSKTSLSSDISSDEDDTTRVIYSWHSGLFVTDDIQASEVTCISMPHSFSIFIFYSGSKLTHFCRLFFDDDSLGRLISEPSLSILQEYGCRFPLQYVKSMVYMQCSRRMFFVTMDESFYITKAIDGLIDNRDSCDQIRGNHCSTSKSTDRQGDGSKSMTDESDESSINIPSSSAADKANYQFKVGANPANFECMRLPPPTALNKTIKSFRSDDTMIRNIYAIETDTLTNIAILIESE